MSRVWTVARREYVERVRARAFLVGTLLGPLILLAVMIGPSLLMAKQRGRPLRVAVLDDTGTLRGAVEKALLARRAGEDRRFEVTAPAAEEGVLRARVIAGELDGFVHVEGRTASEASASYYGRNVSNLMDIQLVEKAVAEAVGDERLQGAGLPTERIRALTRPPSFRTVKLTAQGAREDRREAFLLSAILLTLLYTSLAMWGAAIMNGVLEEKTNRVVEVVVSSIPPRELFAGKLLGVGAVGLTQFLTWGTTLTLVSLYAATAGAAGGTIPTFGPSAFLAFVGCFVLGYFFYGALFAALGASVSSQQDTQSLTFLVMMPLVLALALFPMVLANPDGRLAVVLSMVPFFAPLHMFLRISAVTPPAWQIALSAAIMLASIALVVVAAARIYRVGILMYGKRATFAEMAKWVRQS